MELLQMKAKHIEHWTDVYEHQLELLENVKILSSTKEERAQIRMTQSEKREQNKVDDGQRIRVKSTGELGTRISDIYLGGNPTGMGSYQIMLDGNSELQHIDRDDFFIICKKCNLADASQRCSRCKKVWYCARSIY
mmetsp:Transcript_26187/g.26616  ORF Transcript_26187/g.26616 Transcript_26187/m.26616 type:complete len:136 (+) Transcript_26187:138-545(+)